MDNKWRIYIDDLLINSNQIDPVNEEWKNDTLILSYEYKSPDNSSVIYVGLLEDNRLIYFHFSNELTPGYNHIHCDYFFCNDFDDTIPGDEVGLDFNPINCEAIKEIISGGEMGEEVQWIKDGRVLKSGVVLFDSGFYDYHDFTKRSIWQRLWGPRIHNMPGVNKKRINLSELFPPIEIRE